MQRETISIVQLGVAFLLIFTAFNSAGYIQEGVLSKLSNETGPRESHIDKAAGYTSLSIIYAVFTVANLMASPIVNLITAKWAMVAGASCYLLFMLLFVIKVMEWSLYLTSAGLGFGAAILWTGQGTYITQNSNDETMGRNSAITWSLLQMCSICGGIFLYVALPANYDNLSVNTVRTVYGSFSAVSALGILCLILLRQPLNAKNPPTTAENPNYEGDSGEKRDSEEESSSPAVPEAVADEPSQSRTAANFAQAWLDFVDTLKLLITPDMLLLTSGFFFTGLETGFWTGVYATCLVNTTAFTLSKNTTYALHAIFVGLGEATGGGAFGLAGHRTNIYGRNPIIILGFLCHLIAYYLAYLILPPDSPISSTSVATYWIPTVYVAFAISFLLGLADACWNTQIYSLLGTCYKDNSAPAFALFKMWQSLGACISFLVSSHVGVQYQLLYLVLLAFIGSITFFPVEFKAAAKLQVTS